MIEINELRKIYTIKNGYKKEVIKNINLKFNRAEFVSILGESGSGKSSLLNILGGLDFEYEGTYFIDNQDSKEIDWSKFRKERVGFIFQDINLIPHLTVLENVELALIVNGISKEERRSKSFDILKKVGLENQIDKKPGYLSGGEKQRVAIARALVNNPDIILADEPTGQLDTETAIEILDLLKNLCKDKLVIMVTHTEEFADKYATRIIKIEDGKILSDEKIENSLLVKDKENKIIINKTINIKDIFSLSLKNIFSFKRLTILLLLVLTLGMTTFILIIGIGLGLKDHSNSILKVNNEINLITITINGSNLNAPLYSEYKEEITKIDNLKNIYFNTHLLPIINFDKNVDINDQVIQGLDSELQFVTYTLKDNSYFEKHILVGNYPQNKYEILIGRKTAINLIYEFNHGDNIQTNNLSSNDLLKIVKNMDITYFTSNREGNENSFQFKYYYVQPLSNKFKIVGVIDDDNMPMISTYRNGIDFYEPRIFVQENSFYEIINQFKDKPLETNIMDYYTPHHLLIDTNTNDYQLRLKTIKEILSISTDFHYYNDHIDELYNYLNSFSLFLLSIGIIFGSIIFLITLIIIGGLIYRNMENRKLEFGILFSLGFNKNQIKKILFFESIILSTFGLLASFIISYIISIIIRDDLNKLVFNMLDQEKFMNISLISIKWYIIVVVFILISYIFIRPINKFSRLDIIKVLRKE